MRKTNGNRRQMFSWSCHLVHRPNPCDNVYCGSGQCREGICECHSGYTGARCDIPRTYQYFVIEERLSMSFLFFLSQLIFVRVLIVFMEHVTKDDVHAMKDIQDIIVTHHVRDETIQSGRTKKRMNFCFS